MYDIFIFCIPILTFSLQLYTYILSIYKYFVRVCTIIFNVVILQPKVRDMKTIGYINNSEGIKDIDNVITTMKELGCTSIFIEERNEGACTHPIRNFVLSELNTEDTLVVYSLYDMMNTDKECLDFLRRCVDEKIRFISIFDELDSSEIVYPFAFSKIVKALHETKKHNHIKNMIDRPYVRTKSILSANNQTLQDRYRIVINIYACDEKIADIAKETGYTRRHVSRILKKFNIVRDRCPIPEEKRKFCKPLSHHAKDRKD